MPHDELSPEQEAEVERLAGEAVQEAARVGVDWEAAAARMRALAEQERAAAEGAAETRTLRLDMAALLAVLRRLPDGAGTERFLAEFAAEQPGRGAGADPAAARMERTGRHGYEYRIDVSPADAIAGGRYGFVATVVDLRRRRDDGSTERFATPFGQYHGEDAGEAESRAREGVERWIEAQRGR